MNKKRLLGIILALGGLSLLLGMGGITARAEEQQATPAEKPNVLTVNPELIGQIGGATYAVAWQDNYAYIGVGPRLVILDVTDPAAPVFTGQTGVFPELVQGVAVAGSYAYVADGDSGLRIIDASNQNTPIEVGFYDTPGRAYDVAVAGSYVYVADEIGGLRIIDVSNPAAPWEVGFSDTPSYAYGVAVAGTYAYVANGEYVGLWIFDVSNPAVPLEKGFYVINSTAYDVTVAGSYAYVAAADHYREGGLFIINITNPSAPILTGYYRTFGTRENSVAVAGNYAYLTDDVTLWIINISNPDTPTMVGYYDNPGLAVGVTVAGNYAYVADEAMGLRIIDISNPEAPSEAGFYKDHPSKAHGITVAGNYAYVADYGGGLHIIDVSNPSAPNEAGFIDTPSLAMNVTVVGNYAYVADYTSGLRIIDISNPTAPVEVGFYDTPSAAFDLTVVGNYAYVADDLHGLSIINITNPTAPVEVGYFITPAQAMGVAVAGNYAYVGARWMGLRIIDVSNPHAPHEVGHYDPSDWAEDVTVVGNYAYVVGGGLRIINISNPAAPIAVGYYDTPTSTSDVAVIGNNAYVTNGVRGLHIIDVSNPADPIETSLYNTPGSASGVKVAGSFAYVADDEGGMDILRVLPIAAPIATDDSGAGYITDENTAFLTEDVLSNDFDPNGNPLFVERFDASGSVGEISQSDGGSFNYDPNGQFEWLGSGEQAFDTFTYVASNGVLTDTATVTITVNGVNDAPVAEAGDNQEADEGQAIPFTGSFTDPDWQGGLFQWDFGDGFTATGTLTPTHTYFDNGVYMVTLTVIDDEGAAGSDWLLATINNVAPWMDMLPDMSVRIGSPLTLTATFSDPGLLDTHQAVIEWAPGFTQTLDLAAGDYELSANHTYAEEGEYLVTVTVSDDDGGVISRSFTVTVWQGLIRIYIPIALKR
jgi:VCBS repeat-containing protein